MFSRILMLYFNSIFYDICCITNLMTGIRGSLESQKKKNNNKIDSKLNITVSLPVQYFRILSLISLESINIFMCT